MGTPSLSGAIDSSVMYLLETAHSSFCSRRMAPTSRVMAASLGKMPTTLVRRLTSAWSRSIGFVECNFWRCSLGKWNGRLPPLMSEGGRAEVDPHGPTASKCQVGSVNASQANRRVRDED